MKKIVMSFLILTVLMGCSKNVAGSEKKIEDELNPEDIMVGDFSSVSGEYVNSEGKVIFLDDDGLNDNERQTKRGSRQSETGFSMGIHLKTEGDGGYLLMVFPKGGRNSNLEGLTDLTKVRICYGQDYPRFIEEIFVRKIKKTVTRLPIAPQSFFNFDLRLVIYITVRKRRRPGNRHFPNPLCQRPPSCAV